MKLLLKTPNAPLKKMNKFEQRRETLIKYLLSMVEVADWHAVSDVANDLRELEAVSQFFIKRKNNE